MSSVVPDSSSDGGNTISPSPRQISPAKRWCFTYHNYTENDISSIVPILDSKADFYIFSEELGSKGETPHLQGYIEFKTKCRPKGLLPTEVHWEKSKGTRIDNVNYISKEGGKIYSKGLPKPVKTINFDDLYVWQKDIIDIITKEPDDRKIYWFWGSGGIGKTSFCKYLTVHHNAICLSGKGADMRNGIVEYKKTNGDTPELILINIPRSFKYDYISYEGMESVKDMYFYSGKYEGGMICGNCPHLIIFANEPPDRDSLSADRWIVRSLDYYHNFIDLSDDEKILNL